MATTGGRGLTGFLVACALVPSVWSAHFTLDHCEFGDVPAYRASLHNCQARCKTEKDQVASEAAFKKDGAVSSACDVYGTCSKAGQTSVRTTEAACANTTQYPGYDFTACKFLDAASNAIVENDGPGYVARSKPTGYTVDTEGNTCFALEGKPEQPTYKLPMCKMYNEKSCCAPIHDAETQWAYETLVDVADRCLQYVNEEHFALREFFCIVCDSEQSRYTSMVADPGDALTDANLQGTLSQEVVGEIRICKSFADRVWFNAGDDYDRCGFIIYTDADPVSGDTKIVPFGDVNPATGDDPILPSKYWKFNTDKGTAIEQFFNEIKPGMLDKFQFRVIDDVTDPAKKISCFWGSGGATAAVPQLLVAVVAAVVLYLN